MAFRLWNNANFFDIVRNQKEYLEKLIQDLENEDKLVETLNTHYPKLVRAHKGNLNEEAKELLGQTVSKARELLELIKDQEQKASSFGNIPDMMESVRDEGIKKVFGDIDRINTLTGEVQDDLDNLVILLKQTKIASEEVEVEEGREWNDSFWDSEEASLNEYFELDSEEDSSSSKDQSTQNSIIMRAIEIIDEFLRNSDKIIGNVDKIKADVFNSDTFAIGEDKLIEKLKVPAERLYSTWLKMIRELKTLLEDEDLANEGQLTVLASVNEHIKSVVAFRRAFGGQYEHFRILIKDSYEDRVPRMIETQIKATIKNNSNYSKVRIRIAKIIVHFYGELWYKRVDYKGWIDDEYKVYRRAQLYIKKARSDFNSSWYDYIRAYNLMEKLITLTISNHYNGKLFKLHNEIKEKYQNWIDRFDNAKSSMGEEEVKKAHKMALKLIKYAKSIGIELDSKDNSSTNSYWKL